MSLRHLLALLGLGLLLAGCEDTSLPASTPSDSPAPVASPIPLGDNCLVGKWRGVNQSSYTTKGSLAGYAGAIMAITASGLETTDYNTAQPSIGTEDGASVTSTLHGQWSFQDAATASSTTKPGTLTRTAVSASLFQTLIIANASPQTIPVHAKPTSIYDYRCTTTQLILHVYLTDPKGEFLDVYSRIS